MSRIENALEKALRMHDVPQVAVPSSITSHNVQPHYVPKNPLLVTLTEPGSPAAEEYRKLKAMVIKLTQQDSKKTVIMVTSSNVGEGKSLTAANLAISLAQEVNHSALLIDADLRRPSLAAYLDIAAGSGLAECLRDGVEASSAIIDTGIPKLGILPAGKSIQNPVELLSSPKMKMLIHELKRQYADGYIVIDTPPILPFAETQVLSMLADGVLLVVKEGVSTVKDIQDSLDLLTGTRVLGVAFNGMSASAMSNRHRHYYDYYAARSQQKA